MPRRWNPLRAFALGACFGAVGIGFNLVANWDPSQVPLQVGAALGGTMITGFIFSLVAVARNLAVGNPR